MDLNNEAEIKAMAAQLRKPTGEKGIEVGHMMNEGNRPMNLHTLAVLDAQPRDHILEIGMGNGHFVPNILSLDPSIQYTGCDYSDLMIKEATANNQTWVDQQKARFVEGTIEQLPFEDHSFTKAFTVNTIYFWEHPDRALQELKRVLKPEGKLVLSLRPKRNMAQYPVTEYGFTHYSKEEVFSLLAQQGFTTITYTEVHEPPQERWGKEFQRESLMVVGFKA